MKIAPRKKSVAEEAFDAAGGDSLRALLLVVDLIRDGALSADRRGLARVAPPERLAA